MTYVLENMLLDYGALQKQYEASGDEREQRSQNHQTPLDIKEP